MVHETEGVFGEWNAPRGRGWLRSTRPEPGQAQILDVDDPTPPDHEPSTFNETLTEIEDGKSSSFGVGRRGRHPTFHVQPL